MLAQGGFPHGSYPPSHLYPLGQTEATNLSLPPTKQGEQRRDEDFEDRDAGVKAELDVNIKSDHHDHKAVHSAHGRDPCHCHDNSTVPTEGSERTRGKSSKTDDRDKIKSSSKAMKSPPICKQESNTSGRFTHCDIKPDTARSRNAAMSPDSGRSRHLSGSSVTSDSRRRHTSSSSKSSLHSPSYRLKAPEGSEEKSPATSNDRKDYVISPYDSNCEKIIIEQDMPENLCIKDRKKDTVSRDAEGRADHVPLRRVLTQGVTSPISVTITTTCSADHSPSALTTARRSKGEFHVDIESNFQEEYLLYFLH